MSRLPLLPGRQPPRLASAGIISQMKLNQSQG